MRVKMKLQRGLSFRIARDSARNETSRTRNCHCAAYIRIARKGIHFMRYHTANIPVSRTGKPAQTAFRASGFLRGTQDSPRTIGRIACLVFARVASFLEALPLHLQKSQIAYTGGCRISSASSYSPRRASMGSVLDARLAGSAEAASASSTIAMAESASTPGSNGLTSNRKERSKRDAATAPSKPNPQPTAASLAPELRMNRITPERWQPSAIRTAISCSRNATENEITL